MKTTKHFGKTASHYEDTRSKGILGRIVHKETTLVLKHLNIQKEESILDAGCGSGHYSLLITQQKGRPYGIDFSQEMITELKKKNLHGEIADLEHFSLSNTFDKILCAGALEFLNKPEKTLSLFHHHLKEKGILVLLYPRISPGSIIYKSYHFFHSINIHLFTKKEIETLLKNTGFKILHHEKASINCSVLTAIKQ